MRLVEVTKQTTKEMVSDPSLKMIQILKCGGQELGILAKGTGCQLTLVKGQSS